VTGFATLGRPLDLVTDPLAPGKMPVLESVPLGAMVIAEVISDAVNLCIVQSSLCGICTAVVWKNPPLR
jgi:hypothetical protein